LEAVQEKIGPESPSALSFALRQFSFSEGKGFWKVGGITPSHIHNAFDTLSSVSVGEIIQLFKGEDKGQDVLAVCEGRLHQLGFVVELADRINADPLLSVGIPDFTPDGRWFGLGGLVLMAI
jgi:hypothetical protein